ncbi:MAG: hypothetical protein WCT05_13665, partial [Lentisphaeria bacterium]
MLFLLIIFILAGAGLLLLGITFVVLKRLVKENPAEQKTKFLLYQPFQELLLGFLFTFAGFYFAQRIFGGPQALPLALGIAGVISAMSSWGAYSRLRQLGQELSLPEPETRHFLLQQRLSCVGIFCVLLS